MIDNEHCGLLLQRSFGNVARLKPLLRS